MSGQPLHITGPRPDMEGDPPSSKCRNGQQWPITNEVQRQVLIRMLKWAPNDVRLTIAAAFLKVHLADIYAAAGMSQRIRMIYGNASQARVNGHIPFHEGPAWYWVARVAKCLGIKPGKLWQMDEDFDPVECLPIAFDNHGRVLLEKDTRPDFFGPDVQFGAYLKREHERDADDGVVQRSMAQRRRGRPRKPRPIENGRTGR